VGILTDYDSHDFKESFRCILEFDDRASSAAMDNHALAGTCCQHGIGVDSFGYSIEL
jgi:hypothetical protein